MSTASPTARRVYVAGVMEHIEEAGIHSGDCACSLPPYTLSPAIVAELKRADRGDGAGARRRRADERAVRHQGRRRSTCWRSIRAPRARCRSSPRRPACRWPRSAPRVMAGAQLADFTLDDRRDRAACRGEGGGVPVRPLPGRRHASSGPEMKSTGEVMGLDAELRARLRQSASSAPG